jgi:hypothetical protein
VRIFSGVLVALLFSIAGVALANDDAPPAAPTAAEAGEHGTEAAAAADAADKDADGEDAEQKVDEKPAREANAKSGGKKKSERNCSYRGTTGSRLGGGKRC